MSVEAGTVRFAATTSFGARAIVAPGATLAVTGNGASVTFPATGIIDLNGGTLLTDENLGFVVISSGINILADSTINIQGTGTTGNISNLYMNGGLNSAAPRTVTLNASTVTDGIVFRLVAGTFNVAFIANRAGPVPANKGTIQMSNGTTATFANADLTLNNATWNIGLSSNNDTNAAGNNFSAKSLNGNGIVVSDSRANILTVGTANGSGSFSGSIADGVTNTSGLGQLSLTKTGSGTQTLSGVNTYTGPTAVNEGTLAINGSIAGAATVSAGTLRGGGNGSTTGLISGNVIIGDATGTGDAILSPGNSVGTLATAGTLALDSDSLFKFELDSSNSTADQMRANGISITPGATFNGLDLATTGKRLNTSFVVLNNTAAVGSQISGTFANLPNGGAMQIGSNSFTANYAGGDGNDLVLTAVPEPGTALSVLSGLAMLTGLQRFRRRQG